MNPDPLLSNPLVPVASEDDARATMDALLPRLAKTGGSFVALHVIEKAGGAPDKASVEQRELAAADIFDVIEEAANESDVQVETDIRYGTDVVDTIFAAAVDHDASAVVFTPREGSRWLDLITGDVTRDLVKKADRPVVVLPDEPHAGSDVVTDEGSDE